MTELHFWVKLSKQKGCLLFQPLPLSDVCSLKGKGYKVFNKEMKMMMMMMIQHMQSHQRYPTEV